MIGSRRIGLLLFVLVTFGCAGTETGNPSFTGELAYDAYSSDVARVALRSSGASEQPGATWGGSNCSGDSKGPWSPLVTGLSVSVPAQA